MMNIYAQNKPHDKVMNVNDCSVMGVVHGKIPNYDKFTCESEFFVVIDLTHQSIKFDTVDPCGYLNLNG